MLPYQTEKLLLRLGIAMGTITALAFLGMLSSVLIAEAMQGTAGAINQAGTLRMQSYRIATALAGEGILDSSRTQKLIEEFESRLRSPRLVVVLGRAPDTDAMLDYQALVANWETNIEPVLRAVLEAPDEAIRSRARDGYLARVDAFVAQIDHFVGRLESNTEGNIELLRGIHIVSLFLTLGVVILTMVLMHTRILLPLRELLRAAEAARRGEFSVRVRHCHDDELGDLGRAFNGMAEDLSKTYADLEARVEAKTTDLKRSNRSLELLYNTALRLTQTPLLADNCQALLRELEKTIDVGPSCLCLLPPGGGVPQRFATTWSSSDPHSLCQLGDCSTCAAGKGTRTFLAARPAGQPPLRVLSIDVGDQNIHHGVLICALPDGTEPPEWQLRLLEALARHIGTAQTITRRAAARRPLALLEERVVIARELHDSLAQSLSYMKIQAARLEALLPPVDQSSASHTVLEELREGINSAYRQLRELLATFRLRVGGRGLGDAMAGTIEEFRERGLPVKLEFDLDGCHLPPNTQIHVLQIVREALSNVAQHASARQVSVRACIDSPNRLVRVLIEDDGDGISADPKTPHHYGLSIMEERAQRLQGRIEMAARATGGTCVELTFPVTVAAQAGEPTKEAEDRAQG